MKVLVENVTKFREVCQRICTTLNVITGTGNSANPSESEFFTLQNRSESLDFDDLDNVSQNLREFVNKTNGWVRFLSMGSLHTITGHS